MANRLSRRHVIGASLFVWSFVTWWTGHETTFHELLAARALMGISAACYIPAALALITDYHSGRTRSRAVGLHQRGIYLGRILGGFAGYVADSPEHGWRWAFSTCGLIGLIYALPLLAMLRNPARPVTGDLRAGGNGRRLSRAAGQPQFPPARDLRVWLGVFLLIKPREDVARSA